MLPKESQKHIVGLNHITELHSAFDIWCICHLCGVKFRSRVAPLHLFGMKHRLFYMRKYHPAGYQKLKRLYDNNISVHNEIEKQAKLAEERDGRGTPSIQCFDAKAEEEDGCHTADNTKANHLHGFIQWVNAELEACRANFMEQFKGRPLSPILNVNRSSKNDDKGADRPQDYGGPPHPYDYIPPLMSRSSPPPHFPPHRRPPLLSGTRPPPLLPEPYADDPLYPPHMPLPRPSRHDPYRDPDLLPREHLMDMDPLLRDRYLDRDPLLRERYLERDPLLRERYLERDPLLRERYLERNPLLRERYLDRDPLLRERFLDREKDKGPLVRDGDTERGPYFDTDPMYRDRPPNPYRDPLDQREMRTRNPRPDPYMDPEPVKFRPGAEPPYLDPDPLKRPRKPDSHSDPNPPRPRALTSEPYIDPDPLKRVLPSQKVKAKPVIIDYGHGKEEKSEKSKAKEWEDDINDILDSGRKSKGPDSLALLSSSYSSPKRDNSPKRERSPRYVRPTKPLPFERSYLDRAKDYDLLSRKTKRGGPESSYPKRRRSPSPEPPARNPDYPGVRRGHNRMERDNRPFKSSKTRKTLDTISISSESPPWVESPTRSKKSASNRRYVKSPKFKKESSKSSDSSSRSRSRSRSSSSGSSSRSKSSLDSPPRSSKYLRPKGPSVSVVKSKHFSLLKQSSPQGPSYGHRPAPPLGRSTSPFKSSRRSRSKSPPLSLSKSVPSGPPPPRSRTSQSPPPLPKSLPPAPPPAHPPLKSSDRYPRSKSPLPPLPPRPPPPPPSVTSPPRKVSRSKSPSGPPTESLPPGLPLKSTRCPSPPPPRTESKTVAAMVDNADEDAQAERIANMLLSMKSSIVDSEMDDPHAALQALLSSHELTEALLATRAQASTSVGPGERKGASMSSVHQSPEPATQTLIQGKRTPPKPANVREKVAFAFSGKSSVSSRNVPQTFLEEESSDDNS